MDTGALSKPSLTLRIGVGKLVGFIIGLAGFIALPFIAPESGLMLRWGILLWYATLGAVIGVFGVYDRHPVLNLPLPWWIRAPFIGAWMNFVLTLFVYDQFASLMADLVTADVITSPFWFVAEGAIVGSIIGWFATRFGGEGAETVRKSFAS